MTWVFKDFYTKNINPVTVGYADVYYDNVASESSRNGIIWDLETTMRQDCTSGSISFTVMFSKAVRISKYKFLFLQNKLCFMMILFTASKKEG